MTVPAPENGVSRQHKHIEFKVVNLSPQNFKTESRFGNLVQIFSNLPDLSWICENFSFLWPKNKKCCCFWRFQSKLAVPGRYRVKFLRQRTLDDEDTADWREIFIFETFWLQIFNISVLNFTSALKYNQLSRLLILSCLIIISDDNYQVWPCFQDAACSVQTLP